MFEAVWQALIHTPWWVYLIFFYCMFIGVKALKGGVVPFGKMVVIPIIFTYLSLETVYNNFHLDMFVVTTYGISILVGIIVGLVIANVVGLQVDNKKWLLKLPGTWVTLMLLILIFGSKYYFGYAIAADPKLLTNTRFEFWMLAVSAIITGMFIGRVVYYYYRIKKGPWAELAE